MGILGGMLGACYIGDYRGLVWVFLRGILGVKILNLKP